jgi:hypothetical protein
MLPLLNGFDALHPPQMLKHSEAFDESVRERHLEMLKNGDIRQGQQQSAHDEGSFGSSGVVNWALGQGEAARTALMRAVFHRDNLSDRDRQNLLAAEAALDLFRTRAATGTIVLRCMDPRLAKLGTQVLADLTSINWKGWEQVRKGGQAFFEPDRGHRTMIAIEQGRKSAYVGLSRKKNSSKHLKDHDWYGVDFFVQGAGGRRPQGSIVDVQSIIEGGRSIVRINVGKFHATAENYDEEGGLLSWCCGTGGEASDGDEQKVRSLDEAEESERRVVAEAASATLDGCMEVEGYLSSR